MYQIMIARKPRAKIVCEQNKKEKIPTEDGDFKPVELI